MGFEQQLREIIAAMPESRQTLLFSATLPGILTDFVRAGNVHFPLLLRNFRLSMVVCNLTRLRSAESTAGSP
jgi:ATP-dependent RNA helicase DDX54/DBP10